MCVLYYTRAEKKNHPISQSFCPQITNKPQVGQVLGISYHLICIHDSFSFCHFRCCHSYWFVYLPQRVVCGLFYCRKVKATHPFILSVWSEGHHTALEVQCAALFTRRSVAHATFHDIACVQCQERRSLCKLASGIIQCVLTRTTSQQATWLQPDLDYQVSQQENNECRQAYGYFHVQPFWPVMSEPLTQLVQVYPFNPGLRVNYHICWRKGVERCPQYRGSPTPSVRRD